MKKQLIAALFATAVTVMSAPTFAADAAKQAAFSTETELSTLLENPATAAVIEKHFPGLAQADGISMAGSMSLRNLQQFKPDMFTDKALQETDADLAKVAPK